MAETTTNTMTLNLDGVAGSFFVYRLRLHEGISQIARADLELYSETKYRTADLKNLFDKYATVEIRQTQEADGDGTQKSRFVTRWFTGMITGARLFGVVTGRSSATPAYRYGLTIESPMINLCYAHRNRSFVKAKPLDILKKVLTDDYELTLEMKLSDEVQQKLDTPVDFFQTDESDYEFVVRLLATFGLSYNFFSSKVVNDKVTVPVMYLFAGCQYHFSSLLQTADDSCDCNSDKAFDFTVSASASSSGNLNMKTWRMEEHIGVDYVQLDYQTPGNAFTSQAGTKNAARSCFFNFSPFGVLASEKITAATRFYLNSLKLEQEQWTGETSCLQAMPGAAITVHDFYGSSQETEDAADNIKALVAAAELTVTAVWNLDLQGSNSDNEQPDMLIQIACIDQGESAVPFTTPLNGAGRAVIEASASLVPSAATVAIEQKTIASSATHDIGLPLRQAVVCDASGDITGNVVAQLLTTTSGEPRYQFHALLLEASKKETIDAADIIHVWLVMPLGGKGQGLLRIPRLGESILVAAGSASDYYLMGYLPSSHMPFANDWSTDKKGFNVNAMTLLRSNSPDDAPSYLNKNDFLPQIQTGGNGNKFSELGIYNSNESSGSFATSAETLKPLTVEETQEAERQKQEGVNPPDNVAHPDLVNLGSTGQMQISANEILHLNAKNIEIKCPGWKKTKTNQWDTGNAKITVDDFNSLVVTAAHSIKFQVGNNFISISQNGIAIRSTKWTGASGPLDSAIYLDSISGVSVTGARCAINGFFGAGMSDRTGGSVGISGGSTNVSGAVVQIGTLTKGNMIANMTGMSSDFVSQIVGFGIGPDNASAAKGIYGYQTASDTVVSVTQKIIQIFRDFNSTKKGNTWNTFSAVVNVIIELLNAAWLLADAINSDWLSEPTDSTGKVTKRDAFKLAIFCLQTTVFGGAYAMGIAATELKDRSTVKISTGKLDVLGSNLQICTAQDAEGNTALCALPVADAADVQNVENNNTNVVAEGIVPVLAQVQ